MSVSEPWQDSCPNIAAALTYMMKKEILVDVFFKHGKDTCLFAHKLVLSLWSPYFADRMKQSSRSSPLIITFHQDKDVMEALLEYIYSASYSDTCFTKLPIGKLIQVMEITERFGMTQIHQRCLSSMQRRKIDPQNVIEFFDYGLRKNLDIVVQKCVRVLTHHGISLKSLRESISVTTILGLLTLDRINLESEASLLSLAISWLSHPMNKSFKYEILSYVDLLSIEWAEYQTIWKMFPNFFSEPELSSILFGVAQQDINVFPNWYKPRISSVVEKKCDSCTVVHKKLNISKCFFLKWNYRRDLMDISQAFDFSFQNSDKARLVSLELNFGPSDIPENEIMLKFSKSGVGQWKECHLDKDCQSHKYIVIFREPLTMKTNDSLTLKFHFRNGLVANKIQVVMPNIIESQKLNEALKKDFVKVELKLSKLAFYCALQQEPKLLVSSFCFNVCPHHATYLVRKRISKPDEAIIKMDTEHKSFIPKIESIDMSMIKKEYMLLE